MCVTSLGDYQRAATAFAHYHRVSRNSHMDGSRRILSSGTHTLPRNELAKRAFQKKSTCQDLGPACEDDWRQTSRLGVVGHRAKDHLHRRDWSIYRICFMCWSCTLAAIPLAFESSPPSYTAGRARRQEMPCKVRRSLGGVLSHGKVPNDSVPLLSRRCALWFQGWISAHHEGYLFNQGDVMEKQYDVIITGGALRGQAWRFDHYKE